jgi:hypothetical protein
MSSSQRGAEFYASLSKAQHGQYEEGPGRRVRSQQAFEEQREHRRKLYDGVQPLRSFLGDAGPELTVRSVYVAGVDVNDTNDFNFRSWSVVTQPDRLAAYADGGDEASLPVKAYLFGGCLTELAVSQEAVVQLPPGRCGSECGRRWGRGHRCSWNIRGCGREPYRRWIRA